MIDGNGRIKLSSDILKDFHRQTDTNVVLHCLPEKAVAIYPPQIWQTIRGRENDKQFKVIDSLVRRRVHRRFGSMSVNAVISNQGRVTIPSAFRLFSELVPNSEVMLVGCEIGVEVWNFERWQAETEIIQQHVIEKGENEMNIDLWKDSD